MQNFIALLRGINVGGQKKIKMAELRKILSESGFEHVQTYIQSGNVIFQSEEKNTLKLAEQIHQIIENSFGFLVPILVISVEELQTVLDKNPFNLESDEQHLFFTLLKQPPDSEKISKFEEFDFDNEDFCITDRCVYLSFIGGYRNAKLNNNFIEKKLGVEATTRNLRTMQKLLEMTNG